MYVIMGVAATMSAVVLYGWALGLTRSSTAPDWAKSQLFSSLISLAVVGLAPLGVGFIVAGLAQPLTGLSIGSLVVLALSLPVMWVVFGRLVRRGGQAARHVVPMPVPPASPTPLRPKKMAA